MLKLHLLTDSSPASSQARFKSPETSMFTLPLHQPGQSTTHLHRVELGALWQPKPEKLVRQRSQQHRAVATEQLRWELRRVNSRQQAQCLTTLSRTVLACEACLCIFHFKLYKSKSRHSTSLSSETACSEPSSAPASEGTATRLNYGPPSSASFTRNSST